LSIHDKTHSIWEELVRIREVIALDSYARQLSETQLKLNEMDSTKGKTAEHMMICAEELDRVRTDMRKRAYPMEHL